MYTLHSPKSKHGCPGRRIVQNIRVESSILCDDMIYTVNLHNDELKLWPEIYWMNWFVPRITMEHPQMQPKSIFICKAAHIQNNPKGNETKKIMSREQKKKLNSNKSPKDYFCVLVLSFLWCASSCLLFVTDSRKEVCLYFCSLVFNL